ncbi:fork head protein homolog 2-like [Amphibalanus amphitrite]|uniref:fork head protein homolog 2-like n=1 Tax=Amphibalanus amphitrite TaxID=1232801 RepID=UPI001C9157E9|nr:fork head protein homolog 2-like [Amphibalanus amphitrite]
MVEQEPVIMNQERTHEVPCSRDAGKPPFTYTELIEQALLEEGQLTVSGIYRWITSHFSFYKSCDDRWKNSVRHNLSMNPYFRKGCKAGSGAGHLWTLADVDGRRVRRNQTAARMGRPSGPTQCANGGGDRESGVAADATVLELKLCEDTPSPSQEIWLSSSPPEDEQRPDSPPVAADPGFVIQYCTFTPEVAATVELPLEESVGCELNNNTDISCGDGPRETQLFAPQFRNSLLPTNNVFGEAPITSYLRDYHDSITIPDNRA